MVKSVLLLRGVNVGGKNPLPMKSLTGILEEQGFSDVRTVIQSGNAVVSGSTVPGGKAAAEVAARIKRVHGFAPGVEVLLASQWRQAVASNPFADAEPKAVHFYFLSSRPRKPDLARLKGLKAKTEDFKLKGAVFYLLAPDGIARSKLAAAVEGALGVAATARNANTVARIHAVLEQ